MATINTHAPVAPPVTFSLYRGLSDPELDAAESARVGLIPSHLSRAVSVMLRLKDAEFMVSASLSALDRLKPAVLLVAQGGKVGYANRAANRLLAEEKAAP